MYLRRSPDQRVTPSDIYRPSCKQLTVGKTTSKKTEWRKMSKLYSSEDVDDWLEALQLATSWHQRGTNPPAIVSLTLTVLKARLNEMWINADESLPQWIKEENIRHFHSLVIIRFINFLYEIIQCRQSRMISIREAVAEFNIPPWIVELRHKTTHSTDLPDYTLCRDAVYFLSDWLKVNYWNTKIYADNAEHDSNTRNQKSDLFDSKIRKALRLYNRMNKSAENRLDENAMKMRRRVKLNAFLSHAIKRDPRKFFVELDRNIIMRQSQLAFWKWDIHEDSSLPPPRSLRLYWNRMFSNIRKSGHLIDFIEFLIGKMCDCYDQLQHRQYKGWLICLLDDKFQDKFVKMWQLEQLFMRFLKNRSLEMFMDNDIFPRYRYYILSTEKLENCSNATAKAKERIERLQKELKLVECQDLDEEEIDYLVKQPILDFSRDALKNGLDSQNADDQDSNLWSDLPLGLAPGQHCSTLTLELNVNRA
uniref:LAS1-like protein n=1 Tax=Romanomermis culicivorax TaxID=13658 RepID=A0A915IPR6_ROMCU